MVHPHWHTFRNNGHIWTQTKILSTGSDTKNGPRRLNSSFAHQVQTKKNQHLPNEKQSILKSCKLTYYLSLV